jgi:hypothetical protein
MVLDISLNKISFGFDYLCFYQNNKKAGKAVYQYVCCNPGDAAI